jgi:hypothetical protein
MGERVSESKDDEVVFDTGEVKRGAPADKEAFGIDYRSRSPSPELDYSPDHSEDMALQHPDVVNGDVNAAKATIKPTTSFASGDLQESTTGKQPFAGPLAIFT